MQVKHCTHLRRARIALHSLRSSIRWIWKLGWVCPLCGRWETLPSEHARRWRRTQEFELRGAVRCVVACCHQPILSLHVVTLSSPTPHPILNHVLETRLVKEYVPALPIPRSPLTPHTEAKDIAILSGSVTPIPSRPTTPRPPGAAEQHAHLRSGMLTIRIFSGASPSYHTSHPP